VFCTQILPDAEKDEIAKGWVELLRTPAEASRQVAHRELEEEFTRPAITVLVLGMAAWLEPDDAGSPVAGDDALNRPIRKPAHALLDRMARRVARGGHPRRRSAEELHALRKALKKLRYSGDYLAAIYPPKPVKQYQKASKRLLKLLGTGTDAAMATRLAGRLCAGARSEVAPAANAPSSSLAAPSA
jgi:triphosphatase